MRIFFLVLAVFSSLLLASQVYAVTVTINSTYPDPLVIDTPFNIDITISGSPNTSYNLKGRIGADTSSLTKGLTNNPSTGDWLTDTSSWTNFPTATTDNTGSWSGSATLKTSTSATAGTNLLVFRIHSPTGSNYDSSQLNITLITNPIPTSTPTPGPTNTPTPTPTPSANFTFTTSTSTLNTSSSMTVNTSISGLSPNSKYYLKGAFLKDGSSNYFGQTKVSGSWVKNYSSYSSQYPINSDSSGNWSGSFEVMPDSSDSGYTGSGSYLFKLARYTDQGSGPIWSNQININITGNSTSSTSLTPTPTPTTSPTISSSQSVNQTTSKQNIQNQIPPDLIASESSVAGISTEAPSHNPEYIDHKSTNPLLIIAGCLLTIASGGILYLRKRYFL